MLDYSDLVSSLYRNDSARGGIAYGTANQVTKPMVSPAVLIQAWYGCEYLFTVDETRFNPPRKGREAVIQHGPANKVTWTLLRCENCLRSVQTVPRRKVVLIPPSRCVPAGVTPREISTPTDIMTAPGAAHLSSSLQVDPTNQRQETQTGDS